MRSKIEDAADLVVLFLPPAASDARRASVQAALARELTQTYPEFRFQCVIHAPPMFDGVTDEVYVVPPRILWTQAKIAKRLKQEVFAGCVSALREAGRVGAALIAGEGQGAIIAASLSRPRLVEAALAARQVQDDEATMFSEAWHGVRAILCQAPRVHVTTRIEQLQEAIPEITERPLPGEDHHHVFVISPAAGSSSFSASFWR